MPIAGSAADVVRFLARPKLGLSKDMLYDSRRVGGEVAVDLSIGFPLLNALTVAELDIKAEATLSKFSLRGAIGDVDLSDTSAQVKFGGSELTVSGTGSSKAIPIEISWRSHFGAKVPFRQRYDVKGNLPLALIAKAGLPSPEPWIKGPITTTLSYQVATNGASEVVGRFEIRGRRPAPAARLGEGAGDRRSGQMTARLASGARFRRSITTYGATALQSVGQVRFGGDSSVQHVVVQQFRIGRTDIAGEWRRAPGGVKWRCGGVRSNCRVCVTP